MSKRLFGNGRNCIPGEDAAIRCPNNRTCLVIIILVIFRDGSGSGKSEYSSKSVPFGPVMDYTYWTVDVYGDTRINPREDGGGDGLTLTPVPYPSRPAPSSLRVK